MKNIILNSGRVLSLAFILSFTVNADENTVEPIRAVARSAPNANIEKMESFCFRSGDKSQYLNNEKNHPKLAKYPELLELIESLLIQKVKGLNYRLVESGSCDFYITYEIDASKHTALLGNSTLEGSDSIAGKAKLFDSGTFVLIARKSDTDRTLWMGTVKQQLFDLDNIPESREELVQLCGEFTTLLIDERFPPRKMQ